MNFWPAPGMYPLLSPPPELLLHDQLRADLMYAHYVEKQKLRALDDILQNEMTAFQQRRFNQQLKLFHDQVQDAYPIERKNIEHIVKIYQLCNDMSVQLEYKQSFERTQQLNLMGYFAMKGGQYHNEYF